MGKKLEDVFPIFEEYGEYKKITPYPSRLYGNFSIQYDIMKYDDKF